MKATKKLITASVALVAALAVSVGSTYAWFTQQSYVQVSGVEASVVESDTDLLVRQINSDGTAVSGYDFSYNLNLKFDETFTNTTVLEGFELDALTTDDKGATLYTRQEFEKASEKTAATGHYIVFYLQFKANKAVNVVLKDSEDTSVAPAATASRAGNISAWKAFEADKYKTTAIDEGSPLETNVANATRLAFLEGTKSDDNMTLGAGKVWDPQQTATNPTGFPKGNLARDYEAYTLGGEFGKYADPAAGDVKLNKKAQNEQDAVVGTTLVTTSESGETGIYYGYVCVKIWVEGRDGDCFNYILGDKLAVKLCFEGVEA